jgi:hypothetical protein
VEEGKRAKCSLLEEKGLARAWYKSAGQSKGGFSEEQYLNGFLRDGNLARKEPQVQRPRGRGAEPLGRTL